ncbi:hypothetical protein HGRIS_006541 [Hohenbuehelia grisea]|uniref:Uncharacterized protein n=1 Tax=Hohenbuehelia grisea TaxID=104357 RepID=A0ABR3J9M8_9AGAR
MTPPSFTPISVPSMPIPVAVPMPGSPPLPPLPDESTESLSTALTPSDIEFSTTEESSSFFPPSLIATSAGSCTTEPFVGALDSQPSLLSTPHPRSAQRSISPASIPSTPVLLTPDASFSVSVSTPHGNIPSIHSLDSLH